MKTKLISSVTCALFATIAGSAVGAEPGEIVMRQASVGTLTQHAVANDPNLLVAYFQPAPYAFTDREQFNLDIWNNTGGWNWASSYAITYPNDTPPFEVLGGVEWTTPDQIHLESKTQTPVFLRFDPSYGSDYVLIVDRALTDVAVRVAGDVNADGDVTLDDANLVAAVSTGLERLSRIQSAIADVNCDNAVNVIDALKIARFSLGLETPGCK